LAPRVGIEPTTL